MYASTGLHERALVLYRRALERAMRFHGQKSEAALRAAANIGQQLDELGQPEEALATLLNADAAARSRAADNDTNRMNIDANLAHVYFGIDVAKGLERARSAAVIARAQGPSMDGIGALSILGDLAKTSGHLEEARKALSDAVAWIDQQSAVGVLPNILASLGDVQDRLGQVEAAGATIGRALALAEKLGDLPSVHHLRFTLARHRFNNGLLREALEIGRSESDWARAPGGDQQSSDLRVLVLANFGRTLVAYGDPPRGLKVLDEARAMLSQETTNRLGQILIERANALVSLGRLTEADADLKRAIEATSKSGGRVVAAAHEVRRRYLAATGRADEALKDLSHHPLVPGEATTTIVLLRREAENATLLLAAGDVNAARTTAASGLATLERLPQRRFVRDAEARMTAVLGEALLREGRATEALPVLQKSLALHLEQYDPIHSPAVANARLTLAKAQRRAAH